MINANTTRDIEEDEIDLRELFKTIWDKKVFIIVFTCVVTILAVGYAYMKTPIYEAKAFIEIGVLNNNNNNFAIENPNNLAQRLKIIYMNNIEKNKKTKVTKVQVVKNTVNLIEIDVEATSNKKAVLMLNEIINDIKKVHKSQINNYIGLINANIQNLQKQKKELENEKNQFDGSMLVKYNLISKLNDLSLQVSSNNIKETQQIGNIIVDDNPIRPKKKMIVVVAFITGCILSIFIVFFMQFIQGFKEEEK
jgi:LPS O-antigen subunit length determinant protein (WzzB/FepE family)